MNVVFLRCFRRLMDLEGHSAFTNDPNDPGGPTKFGFSALGYPDEDIADMTLEKAQRLCLRDYWNPLRCDEINDERIKFQLLESAFHMDPPKRPRRSVITAQLALCILGDHVDVDGYIGPQTINAINRFRDQRRLALLMNILQMCFLFVGSAGLPQLRELINDRMPQLNRYMLGWLRRFETD